MYVLAHGFGVKRDSPEGVVLLRAAGRALLEHRLSGYGMGIDPLPSRPGPGGTRVVDFPGYDAEMADVLGGTALPSGARFTTAQVPEAPRPHRRERVAYYPRSASTSARRAGPQLFCTTPRTSRAAKDDPLVRSSRAPAPRGRSYRCW